MENPFLSGEAATATIKVMKSEGMIACDKHYVNNVIEDDFFIIIFVFIFSHFFLYLVKFLFFFNKIFFLN